nr:reverse transcriptase domain-containing protein [Tanacetum cinerariifolium]
MKSLVSLKNSMRHLETHRNDLRKCLERVPHHGFTELAQIDNFYNGLNDNDQDSLNASAGGNLLSKTTREALQIIENKSKVRYSRNKPNVSRMNTTSKDNASKLDDGIDKLADQISTLVDIFAKKVVAPAPVNAVEESYVTCGGAYAYYNCPNTDSNQPSVCVATDTYNQNQSLTSDTLPSNTIPNPKGEMKAITTRSGVVYERPLIPTPKKVVERETKETTDKEQSNFQGSTAHIQSPVTPIPEPDVSKTLHKPNIPYPSRLNDQKLREKATNLMDKFSQIFQDLHFDISFADALILMLKFSSTIKSLLRNKDKLFELAKIPLKENCSVMLLKNLPEKLRDPGKFLIPCDFLGMDEILGFPSNSSGGNPTSNFEPILSDSSPSLTPFEGSDFILEEIDAYLKDESVSPEIDHADFKAKSSIEEPPELELKELPSHLEYAYLEDRSKVDVIDKSPYPTTVKGVRSFLGHVGFYRRFIQDFPKIARPMTHLLEKETPFVFSKDCIDTFETLKKKLTEALILVVPDWNASDFAIGAVLGQRKTKHFQPIHYASKTMTKAQIHYTTTEKEMLVV